MSTSEPSLPYGPDDYNHQDVLRLPAWVGLAMVYLNKYLILFIIPFVPRMRVGNDLNFLQEVAFLRFDVGLILAGLPALAVLVATIRRVPTAGRLPQWIWHQGRPLLTISALGELALLMVYVLLERREFDSMLAAFAYVDLMIVFFLWRSRRVVDAFREFPRPPEADQAPGEDIEPEDASGPAGPGVLHATRISVVHLGGETDLRLKREVLLGLYASLDALGYDTLITQNFLDTKRLNLIVGFDQAEPRTRLELREKQIDYMVWETDDFQSRGLDDTRQGAPDFHNDYLPALAAAKFVLSPFQDVVDYLNSQSVNTAYTRWGYVPALDDLPPGPRGNRGFDCYFYGHITPERRQLLLSMVDAKIRVKATDYPGLPEFLRNHFISRSRIILNLKRGPHAQTVNPYRIMYALQNGYCVATEGQQRDLDGYNRYGVMADTEDYAKTCRALLDSGDYETACAEQLERLRAEPLTESLRGLV